MTEEELRQRIDAEDERRVQELLERQPAKSCIDAAGQATNLAMLSTQLHDLLREIKARRARLDRDTQTLAILEARVLESLSATLRPVLAPVIGVLRGLEDFVRDRSFYPLLEGFRMDDHRLDCVGQASRGLPVRPKLEPPKPGQD